MTDDQAPARKPSAPAIVWLGVCGLLVIALAPLPYGYYQFLRLVVCVAAAHAAWLGFQRATPQWGWAFVVVALLYNPFLPVHLTRGLWQIINIATVIAFVMAWRRFGRPEPSAAQ